MTALPLEIGALHFIGIGGIGMSGVAEVTRALGHAVQGSDLKDSPILERLRGLGVTVHIGHAPQNLGAAGAVIVSSAVKEDNPELAEARARGLPVVHRAEMLAELMRRKWNVAVAGTHGKTTTTSLVAALLDAGGLDPTVINGGVIQSYGSNARVGSGAWMVVEADESDGSFVKLPASFAIVTNIDPEHMDHFGSFDALRDAFKAFVETTPFYGAAICCIDHPEVAALVDRLGGRRVVRYGFSPEADIRASRPRYENGVACFDVEIRSRRAGATRSLEALRLPMPGEHNVSNALAAIAAADELGVDDAAIRAGLAGFRGVKRRFTEVGVWRGARLIDDYGHHPVEIRAVLAAARASTSGRVIAVHQPHRYTRLSNLFDEFSRCFDDADVIAIADVYPAGESPIAGADRDSLVAALRAHGHSGARALEDADALPAFVRAEAREGDMVICLGAGDITRWAAGLQAALDAGD